jgi:hypothetical protein
MRINASYIYQGSFPNEPKFVTKVQKINATKFEKVLELGPTLGKGTDPDEIAFDSVPTF